MLEIKTITEITTHNFDKAVNEALSEGWELVRRECFITGEDRAITLYAELERIIADPTEEEYRDDIGRWEITRDPQHPFRCRACGCQATDPWNTCPQCDRVMVGTTE